MNYQESPKILEQVKKAKKILLNCHRSPDPDSISSAMSLKKVLQSMSKEVDIICPSRLPEIYGFLGDLNTVGLLDDKFDFSKYDLIIVLDTERWDHYGVAEKPKGYIINLDHHPNSNIAGDIDIVDLKASSTSNILYNIFKDWEIDIDKVLATNLSAGIYADTGFFQYSSTKPSGLRAVADLMEQGADINYLVFELIRQNSFDLVKLWGEFIQNMKLEKEFEFVWSAVPYESYKKLKVDVSATSLVTSLILRTIIGTNFTIAMVEKEKGFLHMSLRCRNDEFDVAAVARELNGGGHKNSAGAAVHGLPFDKAVEKVLEVARRHAKEYKKGN